MRAVRIVVAAALFTLAAATAAAQEGGTNFVAEPMPGSQTAQEGGYFLLEASPGDEVEQSIGLRNDSDEPLELQLAAVDAVTGQRGGASYEVATETPTRTGAWITLERETVTVAAGASAAVSFVVAVPPRARGGQHLAGISIAAPSAERSESEAGEGQAGASIDVQTRRIIAVQVNLPGPAEPELVVEGVTPAARPDGLYLEIAIENAGTALTKAEGTVTVGDFREDFEIDTFVPGTSIAYPLKWTDEPDEGEHRAVVELRYGGDTAEWSGTVTVGDVIVDELTDRQVSPSGAAAGGGDGELPLVALVVAAIIGALVVLGVVAVVARRRPPGKHSARGRRVRDSTSRL